MEVFVRLGRIRTPEDVYDWMDENIQYGWLDTENGQHIGEMKNFRKSYRTMSLEEIWNTGLEHALNRSHL